MWALSVVSHSSLSPPRLAFLAWGNFHARSRFARSSILEGKWGQLVVYSKYKCMSAFHDRFCQKTRFEASRVVFWSLSCSKELNPFTGCTLHGLLIQMQNISLRSSDMRRKQNFPSFFACRHLAGFILVERVCRKAFRILGLGERKGR